MKMVKMKMFDILNL